MLQFTIDQQLKSNLLSIVSYRLNTIIYNAKPVLLKMKVSNSSNSSAW